MDLVAAEYVMPTLLVDCLSVSSDGHIPSCPLCPTHAASPGPSNPRATGTYRQRSRKFNPFMYCIAGPAMIVVRAACNSLGIVPRISAIRAASQSDAIVHNIGWIGAKSETRFKKD